MSLIAYKMAAGFLILITSLAAVVYPLKIRASLKHHSFLEIGDAFASGIFLGAALFHMLPEAIYGFAAALGNIHYPIAECFCAAGFLILLFLERFAQSISCPQPSASAVPYMITLILIIHSLIEGGALGINTTVATAFIIFLAIIVHKSSESFALAMILNRSHLQLKKSILIIGTFSLMTPLGIICGASMMPLLSSKAGQLLPAGFNAFAAGTFLYMSTLHHINHHQHRHETANLVEFLFLFLGLVIMALLAIY